MQCHNLINDKNTLRILPYISLLMFYLFFPYCFRLLSSLLSLQTFPALPSLWAFQAFSGYQAYSWSTKLICTIWSSEPLNDHLWKSDYLTHLNHLTVWTALSFRGDWTPRTLNFWAKVASWYHCLNLEILEAFPALEALRTLQPFRAFPVFQTNSILWTIFPIIYYLDFCLRFSMCVLPIMFFRLFVTWIFSMIIFILCVVPNDST